MSMVLRGMLFLGRTAVLTGSIFEETTWLDFSTFWCYDKVDHNVNLAQDANQTNRLSYYM